MLSKLEAGGFVQKKKRQRDGDDGRKIYISLTAKGESAVQGNGRASGRNGCGCV